MLGFEEVATRTCVGRERKEVCWGVLASDGVCVDLLTEGAPYVSEILELLREVPFGLLHIDLLCLYFDEYNCFQDTGRNG